MPRYLGPLTPGKLTGVEVLVDAIEADEGLTRMSEINGAFAGGKSAKKLAEHLHMRSRRPQEIRDRKPGEAAAPAQQMQIGKAHV